MRVRSRGKEKRKCYRSWCTIIGRTTYIAERRTTRKILLVQRSVKWWRKVYVAQVGQRPRVIAYRYLLSRWLRARIYAETEKKFYSKIVPNSINSRRNRTKVLSDIIPWYRALRAKALRVIKLIMKREEKYFPVLRMKLLIFHCWYFFYI